MASSTNLDQAFCWTLPSCLVWINCSNCTIINERYLLLLLGVEGFVLCVFQVTFGWLLCQLPVRASFFVRLSERKLRRLPPGLLGSNWWVWIPVKWWKMHKHAPSPSSCLGWIWPFFWLASASDFEKLLYGGAFVELCWCDCVPFLVQNSISPSGEMIDITMQLRLKQRSLMLRPWSSSLLWLSKLPRHAICPYSNSVLSGASH